MRNSYYIIWGGLEGPALLNLDQLEAMPADLSLYFPRALQHMEANSLLEGLTFYLVYSHFDELPSYGNDVVVLLLSDEECRYPAYLGRVRAVFRCFGTKPHLDRLTSSVRLNTLLAIRVSRNTMIWVTDFVQARRAGAPLHRRTPQFLVPQGYGKQSELPLQPIHEREIDVAFVGSIQHRSPLRDSLLSWIKSPPWIASPKEVSRKRMLHALEQVRAERPDLNVHVETTGSYQESWRRGPETYSETLMNTKICLAPRGSITETNRYFEGLRYGCIVITEPHPCRWFYKGSPAIELAGWEQLGQTLDALYAANTLERKHQESLNWWNEVCSERALGKYIANALSSLRQQGSSGVALTSP